MSLFNSEQEYLYGDKDFIIIYLYILILLIYVEKEILGCTHENGAFVEKTFLEHHRNMHVEDCSELKA